MFPVISINFGFLYCSGSFMGADGLFMHSEATPSSRIVANTISAIMLHGIWGASSLQDCRAVAIGVVQTIIAKVTMRCVRSIVQSSIGQGDNNVGVWSLLQLMILNVHWKKWQSIGFYDIVLDHETLSPCAGTRHIGLEKCTAHIHEGTSRHKDDGPYEFFLA